jgi:hypothetical protein
MHTFDAVGCLQAKNVGLSFEKRKIVKLPPFCSQLLAYLPSHLFLRHGYKKKVYSQQAEQKIDA